jgi:hypothetical protein
MLIRAMAARFLAACGLWVIQMAICFSGKGHYDVEVEVTPMDPEPIWVALLSVIGLFGFWVVIVVLFAATGSM